MALDLVELGLTKEELQDRVVAKMCDELRRTWYQDEDGASVGDSPLYKALVKETQVRLNLAIKELADKHIAPKLENLIGQFTLQATNTWGEKKGQPISFTEYLVNRAETYMTDLVDCHGNTVRGCSSAPKQPRLVYLINHTLQHHINIAIKEIIGDANKTLAKALAESCKLELTNMAEKLRISVTTK